MGTTLQTPHLHCLSLCIILASALLLPLINAQNASAPAPATSGPLNLTGILDKAGQFTLLIRLLKSTQVELQLNGELNNTNQGLTCFAPTDNAFAQLPSGFLNSLSQQAQVALIQSHIIGKYISLTAFQTLPNPQITQGSGTNGNYALNFTATTNSQQVNITTGKVTVPIQSTVYSTSPLALYQVDQVLLPPDEYGLVAVPSASPEPKTSATTKSNSTTTKTPVGTPTGGSSSMISSVRSGLWVVAVGALVGFVL